MKPNLIIIAVIMSILPFLGCNAQNEKKEADFLVLTGPYLGQKPPGMKPEIFAPGVISRDGFEDYG
ncbi:MAG: hypothetical protein K8R74_05670, partial [Bacteroidales bacterium]|nr:hypothetical protein [Bacteroidales bacterium]